MVCTKCGAQLKDTDLFCLHCGEEVCIVPDYNPMEEIVVQNLALAQQDEKVSEDTKNASSDTKKIDTTVLKKEKKDLKVHKLKSKHKKKTAYPKFFMAGILVVVIGFFFWNQYRNSYEYQYNLAKEYVAKENYEGAFPYLEKALSLKSNDIDTRLLMAQAYIGINKINEAVSCLNNALKLDTDNVKIAKQLIEIYSDYNNTDELNQFVTSLKGTKLADTLGEYYLSRPIFSVESGTYDKYISVEITAKADNAIYYTIDGTKPTKNALKYSGQIRLRGGVTKLRAIAVNSAGEYSIENIGDYEVHSTVPDNPIIKPASGLYTAPTPIQIVVPDNCKVYYTLDGSIPTEKSSVYKRQLDMPLGKSTLSVIAIDENGIESNTIQSTYDLQFDVTFSVNQAYDIIVQRLGNELIDEKGSFQLENSRAIEIGGYNLYTFEKVYGTDANGNKIYGNDKYAFDVLTAETFIVSVNAAGGYDLTPF